MLARSSTITPGKIVMPENERHKARTDFYDLYRSYDIKHADRPNSNSSPELSYIKALRIKKRKPETMKLFASINKREVNLQELGMGDSYATILASGIKEVNEVETLNLRNNRLGDLGTCNILRNTALSKLTRLDLSCNSLGSQGFQAIATLLSNENCVLLILQLESVHMQPVHLMPIAQALYNNTSLITLNLAKNKLDERAGHIMKQLLEKNSYIEKLDLHWNGIRGEGLNGMISGLSRNISLLELDLSWNEIGRNTLSSSAISISECLSKNETLKHLDLSNNRISSSECEIISQGLNKNHTIYGLHMEGNYCSMDCIGYIIKESTCNQEDYAHYATRFIHSREMQPRIPRNCWICEKWVDFAILWDPSMIVWNRRLRQFAMSKLAQQAEPVYIHLEIDNYMPFLLEPTKSGRYETIRAIPPRKTRFFFSYRGYAQISSTYRVEAPEDKIDQTFRFYGDFSRHISAVVTNYIEPIEYVLTALPRPERKEYIPPPGDEVVDIPEWKIENSIFKGYKGNNEVILT
jgi:Ran GTPase-activating protein (RanGAP) involved in mRNA processing and transport